jgi:hypothetical protein
LRSWKKTPRGTPAQFGNGFMTQDTGRVLKETLLEKNPALPGGASWLFDVNEKQAGMDLCQRERS